MVGKLSEMVTGAQVVEWLIIAFLVIYFIYKEWPEFRKRVSHGAVKEQKEEQVTRTVEQRLDAIEKNIAEINEKMDRDYKRINRAEKRLDATEEVLEGSMEELEIIMRALRGVLRGLQEQGCNGPTKAAEEEINEYLNRKAHSAQKKVMDFESNDA